LYSRAKILISPSAIEGFGIVIAEALYAGLFVLTWKLPVLEEIYDRNLIQNLILIDEENYEVFAQKAAYLLKKYNYNQTAANFSREYFTNFYKWSSVGEKVISIMNA
jgi:glycosyltransferase involved in cell wall biosynthesis